MIVSHKKEDPYGRVVLQRDHAALVHQIGGLFGNEQFERPEPWHLLKFVFLNHDRGWDRVDAGIQKDPQTGLPYSLVATPMEELLASSTASANFNTQNHPYCGLLSSMHVWGLFNGRYGLSDKVVVDSLPLESKQKALGMLAAELDRQETLKLELQKDAEFSGYLEKERLMQNYKLLQFLDTLALYFNEELSGSGKETSFLHVPKSKKEDCTVRLMPLGDHRYRLSPYPMQQKEVTLVMRTFRVAKSYDENVDYKAIFGRGPYKDITITLVE